MNKEDDGNDIKQDFEAAMRMLTPLKRKAVERYVKDQRRKAVENVRAHTFTDEFGNPQEGFEMGRGR